MINSKTVNCQEDHPKNHRQPLLRAKQVQETECRQADRELPPSFKDNNALCPKSAIAAHKNESSLRLPFCFPYMHRYIYLFDAINQINPNNMEDNNKLSKLRNCRDKNKP